jgi:hypothetical protein
MTQMRNHRQSQVNRVTAGGGWTGGGSDNNEERTSLAMAGGQKKQAIERLEVELIT